MMVIGDVDRDLALKKIRSNFRGIKNPDTSIPRFSIREPIQEGVRRVTIERPSTTNILSLGFKHAPFPSRDWFTTSLMAYILTNGQDSILHKLLVDSGMASAVDSMVEPTSEVNLGALNIYLAPGYKHSDVESLVLKAVNELKVKDVKSLVVKAKEKAKTGEIIDRDSSLSIAADLTEYVSAGDWTVYNESLKIIDSISANDIITCLRECFVSKNLTVGEFIGK